jgi:hypothetical protein
MALKHDLNLEVNDTNNVYVFRVSDISTYAPGFDVKCPTLEITSPGFNTPASIEVLPHFNLVLNACTLGIQNTGCGQSTYRLPDGIYEIRYSIAPSDKLYTCYSHLRVTQTLNVYNNLLCQLEIAACEPDEDVRESLDELRLIKSYIDAAKVKVELCNEPEKGMELLYYAQKKLNKLTDKSCSNC